MAGWICRVGDPSKEMSEEFVITLKTSLAPNKKYTYPLVYAPMAPALCEKPAVTAYRQCRPSLHAGLGMPALKACHSC